MSTLRNYAERITAIHSLFVFDSCFSGFINRSGGKPVPPVIQRAFANPARQFITAGTDGQEVPDTSLFREYFVLGLRGEADTERDGYITAYELYQYVHTQVTARRKGLQTPTYGKIAGELLRNGDMVFPRSLDTAKTSDEEAWSSALATDTVSAYNIFLTSYPFSKHKGSAESKLSTAWMREFKAREEELKKSTGSIVQPIETVFRSAALLPKPFEFTTREVNTLGALTPTQTVSRKAITEDLGDGVSITLVEIPHGSFTMGGEAAEQKPARQVTVSGFHLGIHEVTRKQWQAVSKLPKVSIDLTEEPPQGMAGEQLPKTSISWEEAREFCQRLTEKTGRRYGLPSEAEWEYAARAGSKSHFAFGPMVTASVVNFNASAPSAMGVKGTSLNRVIEVRELGIANAWGLYDMHGNVAEWCEDGYIRNYENAPLNSLARAGDPVKKVVRGGHYKSGASSVCSACRAPAELRNETIGFRVVMRSPIASDTP